MLNLMRQYNALIDRHEKAIKYFEANPDKIDSVIEEYRKIVNQMHYLRIEIAKHAYVMSDDEVLHGFRQIKYLDGGAKNVG